MVELHRLDAVGVEHGDHLLGFHAITALLPHLALRHGRGRVPRSAQPPGIAHFPSVRSWISRILAVADDRAAHVDLRGDVSRLHRKTLEYSLFREFRLAFEHLGGDLLQAFVTGEVELVLAVRQSCLAQANRSRAPIRSILEVSWVTCPVSFGSLRVLVSVSSMGRTYLRRLFVSSRLCSRSCFEFSRISPEDERILPCQPVHVAGFDRVVHVKDHFSDHAQVGVLHQRHDLAQLFRLYDDVTPAVVQFPAEEIFSDGCDNPLRVDDSFADASPRRIASAER
ncbi:MAG: hypothetical protein MZV64_58855 [Ignavibacteriales bacterium]|nr:hypothetical protein [Ignavibacteriales bacterium]